MSQFFDTLKAIALSNKPQSAKVKEMQKATGMTAAAARQQIATIVFMNQSASRAERTNNASLRFTIGVEIECYNLNKSVVLEALRVERVNYVWLFYSSSWMLVLKQKLSALHRQMLTRLLSVRI